MPKDSLSERDRLRLAKLMQEPLLPPRARPQSPQKQNRWRDWLRQNLQRARHKLGAWLKARSAERVRRHFAARRRAGARGASEVEAVRRAWGRAVRRPRRASAAQTGDTGRANNIPHADCAARRKPLVQGGASLPFTCSTGDVFHKTDAPPGWDTFACRGKNVWS